MAKKVINLAFPPEVLQLQVGDTCWIVAHFDYVGPAISGTFYAAIGRVGIIGFDEIVKNSGTLSLPATATPVTMKASIPIDISSAMKVAPGYDIYAKLINIPPGAEVFSPICHNVIEVVGGVPPPGVGWTTDTQHPASTWFNFPPGPLPWAIYRVEIVTSGVTPYPIDSGKGYGVCNDCQPGLWIYPYTEQRRCICRTEKVWVVEPIRYRSFHIVDIYPEEGCWKATAEQHYLGLDDDATREYWKARVPVNVPVAFVFTPYEKDVFCDLKTYLTMFTELESKDTADITNIYQHPYGYKNIFARMIIYNFDEFARVITKYSWAVMDGGLASY